MAKSLDAKRVAINAAVRRQFIGQAVELVEGCFRGWQAMRLNRPGDVSGFDTFGPEEKAQAAVIISGLFAQAAELRDGQVYQLASLELHQERKAA